MTDEFLPLCFFHDRSFTWTPWRSVSLACGLNVSAARAPSTRMCSAPGTYATRAHTYLLSLWSLQNYARLPCNTVPPDPSTVGIVQSFTWGRRFRKIWTTRAIWWIVSAGERRTHSFFVCLVSDDRGHHCIFFPCVLVLVKMHLYHNVSMFSTMNGLTCRSLL